MKRYGDKALEESAARADELAAAEDHNGVAVWRRITHADRPGREPHTARFTTLSNYKLERQR